MSYEERIATLERGLESLTAALKVTGSSGCTTLKRNIIGLIATQIKLISQLQQEGLS